MRALWGIDPGGTKIEGSVLDPVSMRCLWRGRIPTEASGGYEHVLGRIATLVTKAEQESGLRRPDSIGLAMPGNIEAAPSGRQSVVKNANTVCLIGQPLLDDLGSLLGAELIAENDANCFALAEATLGVARESRVVFGVILGTGVGGGIVINGKILPGHHGIAGEWGHNALDPAGAICYCGRRGCVETVISGPSLERWHEAQSGAFKPLAEIARSSDDMAVATIARLCDYFGRGLAAVVNILDPDSIVVGGGVGNVERLYSQGRASLERWIFNPCFKAELVRPALGDSAGVIGAALLSAERTL